jgi:hypothetical protein
MLVDVHFLNGPKDGLVLELAKEPPSPIYFRTSEQGVAPIFDRRALSDCGMTASKDGHAPVYAEYVIAWSVNKQKYLGIFQGYRT